MYDALIIGAGMSGLGAGIRLAHFGRKVMILERHSLWGGLNSFYKKGGRPFDVGLHAMTNFAPRGARGPLATILRQLRLPWEELRLREQIHSEVRFPSATLRFSNDLSLLESEIAARFPAEADGFRRLCRRIREYDDTTLTPSGDGARRFLGESLREPLLVDMILCPLLFYGSATQDDMDLTQFVIMFKSIYFEGLCRPEGGVRRILDVLRRAYRERGGELRLNTGVARIEPGDGGVRVHLENGDVLSARRVLSSAGRGETARLLGMPVGRPGPMTFVETIFCLDREPRELGHDATIVFYSHRDAFRYRRPEGLVDLESGILCCPNNFRDQEKLPEGILRVTNIASASQWESVGDYAAEKEAFVAAQLDSLRGIAPDFRAHVVYRDSFTPRTIERFTSHRGGAVYGAEEKALTGETGVPGVYLCGTDQGYLGIVGSLLSGVLMANRHVLGGNP